jgi:hypothetical protein
MWVIPLHHMLPSQVVRQVQTAVEKPLYKFLMCLRRRAMTAPMWMRTSTRPCFWLSRYEYCYYLSKLPLISMSYEVDYFVPFVGCGWKFIAPGCAACNTTCITKTIRIWFQAFNWWLYDTEGHGVRGVGQEEQSCHEEGCVKQQVVLCVVPCR